MGPSLCYSTSNALLQYPPSSHLTTITLTLSRKDTTLLELSNLISSAFPQISRPNTRLSYRLLFTDSWRPRVILRDIGSVNMDPHSSTNPGFEDAGSRTLEDVKYVIGDWIDVAIF